MRVNPEGLIPLIGGIFAWLAATGRYNPSKDPARWEAWRQRWGSWLKILAPIVIVFGVVQFLGFLG